MTPTGWRGGVQLALRAIRTGLGLQEAQSDRQADCYCW